MAASSIQGTGAQNLPIALRKGCSAVSGIALGPTFASRWRASSLDKPLGDGIAAVDDWAAVESAEGEDIVAAISNCLGLRTVDENNAGLPNCGRSVPPRHWNARSYARNQIRG
jgi:hypothetical protein